MELLRLGPVGVEHPAVRVDGVVYDLRGVTTDIDGRFLADHGIDRVREAVDRGALPPVDGADGLRVGPPVARPTALVCIGQNYAAHAAESGVDAPQQPVVFLKHPNTIVGAHDDVLLPRGSKRTDWEVELAVIIGRRARYLDSPDDALAHVAGYAVSNDVSERDFQLEHSGGQWSKGKCCETFNPLGPALVPAAMVDPQDLTLRSWVNGEPRQHSTTGDMIFPVAHLVWHLSHYLVLEPGDVVNTGTPEGVAISGRFPYLAEGDIVEAEIAALGRQAQRVRSA